MTSSERRFLRELVTYALYAPSRFTESDPPIRGLCDFSEDHADVDELADSVLVAIDRWETWKTSGKSPVERGVEPLFRDLAPTTIDGKVQWVESEYFVRSPDATQLPGMHS